MKVMVVGGGGREHAIVRALRRSQGVTELLCAPGNPGIAKDARLLDVAADDVEGIVAAVEREGVHLTVVGPEVPLVAGLADALDARGHLVFGPSAAAACLEGSKAFAKQAMDEAGVPTARWRHVHSLQEGIDAVAELGAPGVVIKVDGLAGGKGVTVADDTEQAHAALREIFVDGRFASGGDAQPSAIVEERLSGRELSLLAVCDGKSAIPLTPARDYKRTSEGDEGPNTGGMGAYSPVLDLPDEMGYSVVLFVHQPIVDWMRKRGTPFHGILYAGVMLTMEGPKVLEFNVRFGDPEAQAVLPRMGSDFLEMLMRAVRPGGLIGEDPEEDFPWWSSEWAVTVVLASAGYPASSRSGDPISGLDRLPDDVEVTHAGTALGADGQIVTAGGRVLNVTGFGDDAESARKSAYAAAGMISFEGMQLRGDIAASADESPPEPEGWRSLDSWFTEWSGGDVKLESVDG
jgi:phosphoribosylamine--glycine ligase